ncbi:FAD-dependent monooxygenase [Xenorhabdus bovienii]|uniref:FAD-dependent monooxygenase n=1 Tax=Xenorhabdus bovienii TaxID=40576 RepID=UPI00237D16AB|nr:FAD-dependent monooxygenase [Xenorhabdus bovienii]MDE1497134.1 FAD-dependent monooxygenase [Xenorhabdus bovienii]MDE9475123.1 FAD-dependent monooxygenase [Xenorhabdus bovienii]
MYKNPTALIVGTGVGGLSAAIALKNIGWSAQLFEKSDSLRTSGSGLSVMSNASSAMQKLLGIDLDLKSYGAEIQNFEIRHKSGLLLKRLPMQEISNQQGTPCVCISREKLQQSLLDQLGDTNIAFGKRAVDYVETADGIQLNFDDGTVYHGDILVGADGFHSSIREAIQTKSIIQEAGYICWLALVKYSHPQITQGYVVHYWGSGKRIGIIDIGNGWMYWWGTANMPPHKIKSWQGTNKDITEFYTGWPDIVHDIILSTDSSSIITVDAKDRTFPETWTKGRVTLLGDAAHPMLTSLGQGAGLSIEDAAVLGYLLKNTDDYKKALKKYEAIRQPRARAIVNASRALSEIEQYDSLVPRLKRDIGMWLASQKTIRDRLKESLLFDDITVQTNYNP